MFLTKIAPTTPKLNTVGTNVAAPTIQQTMNAIFCNKIQVYIFFSAVKYNVKENRSK